MSLPVSLPRKSGAGVRQSLSDTRPSWRPAASPALGDAAQLLEEAEQYELLPEVAETWDYAELMAREKYPDLPSELFQTPQAAQIGRTMLEEGNGAITEYGLIRRTDGRPLPVFTGKPQREEFAGPQMTGM